MVVNWAACLQLCVQFRCLGRLVNVGCRFVNVRKRAQVFWNHCGWGGGEGRICKLRPTLGAARYPAGYLAEVSRVALGTWRATCLHRRHCFRFDSVSQVVQNLVFLILSCFMIVFVTPVFEVLSYFIAFSVTPVNSSCSVKCVCSESHVPQAHNTASTCLYTMRWINQRPYEESDEDQRLLPDISPVSVIAVSIKSEI